MKDMDTCGNIAFCTLLLYYCSTITADVVSSSAAYSSIRRRKEMSDVNTSSSFSRYQTQSFINSTEYTSHTRTPAGMVVFNSSDTDDHHLNVSFSQNITDGINASDASHVNIQTTVSTVTTLWPSTSHDLQITPPDNQKSPLATPAVITSAVTSSRSAQTRAHVDTPSALDAGDYVLSSDPLLAGLLSACVFIAALVSVLIFLKFRHRNDGAEFSRLQDLPMDDMLEDAPLSIYSY